mmetsp:Transcript_22801/g.52875  ORF Transcript_22801/g.52875 Transcript_22801/m.52875 type:complete len:316 (+) Transcript_22801:2871-3818(+)
MKDVRALCWFVISTRARKEGRALRRLVTLCAYGLPVPEGDPGRGSCAFECTELRALVAAAAPPPNPNSPLRFFPSGERGSPATPPAFKSTFVCPLGEGGGPFFRKEEPFFPSGERGKPTVPPTPITFTWRVGEVRPGDHLLGDALFAKEASRVTFTSWFAAVAVAKSPPVTPLEPMRLFVGDNNPASGCGCGGCGCGGCCSCGPLDASCFTLALSFNDPCRCSPKVGNRARNPGDARANGTFSVELICAPELTSTPRPTLTPVPQRPMRSLFLGLAVSLPLLKLKLSGIVPSCPSVLKRGRLMLPDSDLTSPPEW